MIIFLSMPSAGSVFNNEIRASVIAKIAFFYEKHPEHTFLCPMLQDYQLLKYMSKEKQATWDIWQHKCRDNISVSDEVWVMLMYGWSEISTKKSEYNTSTGVYEELAFANSLNIPIKFVQ